MFAFKIATLMWFFTWTMHFVYKWGSAFVARGGFHLPKLDYNLEPTVSVLMSCFNEGEAVYSTIKSLCENDYPVEKRQIIVFDDCSKD